MIEILFVNIKNVKELYKYFNYLIPITGIENYNYYRSVLILHHILFV